MDIHTVGPKHWAQGVYTDDCVQIPTSVVGITESGPVSAEEVVIQDTATSSECLSRTRVDYR